MNVDQLIRALQNLADPWGLDPHCDDEGTGLYHLTENIKELIAEIQGEGIQCEEPPGKKGRK